MPTARYAVHRTKWQTMKARMNVGIRAWPLLVALISWTALIADGFITTGARRRFQQTIFREAKRSEQFLDTLERVFCLSDLHTDHLINLEWLEEKCALDSAPGPNDLLVVAGDICHHMQRFRQTIEIIQSTGCQVLFIPGNHETWLSHPSPEASSFEKLTLVYETCRELGVHVDNILIGSAASYPLWVVPLQSWYDGSLSIEGCENFCIDFKYWPWADFQRCEWVNFVPEQLDALNARIPIGLADHFHQINEHNLKEVRVSLAEEPSLGLMTVSHFLPNQRCLPDWKDPLATCFRSDEWLDHGATGMSAKFAKVAGSNGLDAQLRSLSPDSGSHIHIFGHSHRPKDFYFQGVRYIHNPLGKQRERDMFMVSPNVDFQLVWDTRLGEVRGIQTMRLWEEQGGGLDGLKQRLEIFGRKRRTVSTSGLL